MANDPGLSNDTCIFMEAVQGDGGTHISNQVWWLSPDITLTGPTSGLDNADPGQVNPVQVKFHKKPDASNCHFPGDESITVQLWVGNPSLAMAPNNAASTALVGFIGSQIPPAGGSHTQQIDWTIPRGLPAGDPQSPGQKCLVARIYPESLTPSDKMFFVPDDPHVAQHNLCVVPCPQNALPNNKLTFIVSTLNPDFRRKERAVVRATLDLKPTTSVRSIVQRRVEQIHGFHALATHPLARGFRFDLTGLQPGNVIDHSMLGAPLPPLPITAQPFFEATITLASPHVVQLPFIVDLTGTQAGDAFIFHLTQTGETGKAQGGLNPGPGETLIDP